MRMWEGHRDGLRSIGERVESERYGDEGMFGWHALVTSEALPPNCDISALHSKPLRHAWLHWNSWIPEPSGTATTSWDTLSFSSSITSVAGLAATIWASAPPIHMPGPDHAHLYSWGGNYDAPVTPLSFQYIADSERLHTSGLAG